MQNYNSFCDKSVWFSSGKSIRREPRGWGRSKRELWERVCNLKKFEGACESSQKRKGRVKMLVSWED